MGFFEEHFLNPILQNGWFNPVNTITYSIILVIAVFLVFKLLFRMGIRIDRKFLYAILPFVVWGSSTRVLHDAAFANKLSPALNAFYSSNLFPTPGSYFITFTLAITVLLLSLIIQRWGRLPYWKPMAAIGWILVAINFISLPWATLIPFAQIIGVTLAWVAAIFGISLLVRKPAIARKAPWLARVFSKQNQVILAAHLLDASATVISLTFYGYSEQHVVPRLLFPLFGPISMFFLKILVVLPVLYIIDSSTEDSRFRNFLKIVVFILGLAPGLRDLIRLMIGV